MTPIQYVICDSPLRSARRFWEIAPKSQFVCVNGILIRFGFRAGAKAIQYNKHSLQQQLWLARKWTYAAMVRNKKEKKNQLTMCLRTFRDKCLFSHDVWYSKENVIFWKKSSTHPLLALLWLKIDSSLLYLRWHFSRNNGNK